MYAKDLVYNFLNTGNIATPPCKCLIWSAQDPYGLLHIWDLRQGSQPEKMEPISGTVHMGIHPVRKKNFINNHYSTAI